jgi:hypothetical protein
MYQARRAEDRAKSSPSHGADHVQLAHFSEEQEELWGVSHCCSAAVDEAA